tara:strand:+ start:1511 stop:1807 length:297 start_codon:yes stop_codon:yes gene_type:complete
MEIKLQNVLSLVPLAVVVTGSIFSYATLSASANENSEDISELSEQVEEIEDEVNELQQQMTRSEIIQQNTAEDLSDVKADTKVILQLLQQNQRRSTSD